MANNILPSAQSFGQKAPTVIDKPNNHLLLADGIYRFGSDFIIILDGVEVCWSDSYAQAQRSYHEMVAAEFCEVAP